MGLYTLLSSAAAPFRRRARKQYLERLQKRGLKLGKNVLIVDAFFFDPSHCLLISIGDDCTICPNVRLIAHDASTKLRLGYTRLGKIEIRDNSFIGDSAIVLPGVTIGPNSIVGAGSIVTSDVPADTVVAGNPARVLCSRQEYESRISEHARGNRVFGADYSIENLDAAKREELLAALTDRRGYIV
jgi:maltose O-acetyltransferase